MNQSKFDKVRAMQNIKNVGIIKFISRLSESNHDEQKQCEMYRCLCNAIIAMASTDIIRNVARPQPDRLSDADVEATITLGKFFLRDISAQRRSQNQSEETSMV